MLSLTDSADEYLKKVGQPNVWLSVKGGGCSGFQYVWDVTDEEPTVGNLVVDPIAEKAIIFISFLLFILLVIKTLI